MTSKQKPQVKTIKTKTMKNISSKIFSLILLFCTIGIYGQQQLDNYYYYKGEKVFLNINTKTISVSFEGESSINAFSSLQSSTTQISEIVEDHTRTSMNSIDKSATQRRNIKTYYMEISTDKNLSRKAYLDRIESYKKQRNILIISPTYTTKEGGDLGLSNNFYVKLKDQKDVDILYKKAKEMNVEVLGHDKYMPLWFTLSIVSPQKYNALNLANIFHETGLFEIAEPAFMYHDLQTSNDTFFNNQWSLKNTGQNGGTVGMDINAEQAWAITTGSPSIKTAVYDHGLEMNHPDLQANIYGTGFDSTNGSSPSIVRGNHGTACGGIVGAVQGNNLGISGVAPSSKLMSISIRLLFSDTPAQLASGFNWAATNGADVISNSWGGYAPSGIIDNAINNALANGRGGKGCVIVFAAGNENNTNIRYPGNSNPDILVVGAMSPCGERKSPSSCDGETFWGSCFGTELDIVAPGVKMPTTDRQGSNGYTGTDYTQTFNGTSSACPVVAGVASLVLSVNPDLTFQEVNDIIEQSAQKVRTDLYTYSNTSGRSNGTWNNQLGYGLVDAHQAVLLAQAGNCQDNVIVNQNVTSGQTDIQKATTSVTATNTIFSGGTATYTAGTRVRLNPGFSAKSGSSFKAFIENCSQSSREELSKPKVVITYEEVEIETESISLQKEEVLKAFPNPTKDRLTITSDEQMTNWELRNHMGNLVKQSKTKRFQKDELNINQLPTGLYILRVTLNNGETIFKNILKN